MNTRLSYTVDTLFSFYFVIILLRCLLSWFSNIDKEKQPLKGICAITDPYLNLFRKLIPALGGIDFSPIIALIVLQVIQQVLVSYLQRMGM